MFKLNDLNVFNNSQDYILGLSPKSGKFVLAICPICNVERSIHFYSVTIAGHTLCQSCSKAKNTRDATIGKVFGRLTVISVADPYIFKNGKKHQKFICKCECGNQVSVLLNNLKRGSTVSCGCFNKDKQKLVRGVNHPNYNHNMTKEERQELKKLRLDSEFRNWKLEVKRLANYKCLICGSSKDVVAHHLASFAKNPELRFSVENGVCLCAKCHIEYHTIFMGGYSIPATLESFDEFARTKNDE